MSDLAKAWTPERTAKFKATMAAKKAAKEKAATKKARKKTTKRKIVVKRRQPHRKGIYPKVFEKEEGATPKAHPKGKSDRSLVLQIIAQLVKLL